MGGGIFGRPRREDALFSDTESGQTFVHTSLTYIWVFSDTEGCAFFYFSLSDLFIHFIKTIELWYIKYEYERGGAFYYMLDGS